MTKTDLIITGSGPGGYRAAQYAAQHGLEVIIFEDRQAGGTCLNEGCIPTKCLVHDSLKGTPFEQAMLRKEEVSAQLRQGVEILMSQPHVTMVKAHARITAPGTVEAGTETYSADNIIIATGSSAKMPPISDIDRPEVMTSTQLLQLKSLPKRLAVVGAGVIGMEFASIFNSFGVKVTVVEFLKECLPTVDSDVAKRARKQLEKRGIDFVMQAAVSSIADGKVTYQRKGKDESIEADVVLVATGRRPNVGGIGLENTGVEYDERRGITVDDNMATNVPGIYAIGDVNGRMMLAHAATFQGYRAVNAILGKSDNIRLDIMPAAIFTEPEIACVGMSEQQCKDAGIDFVLKKGFMRSNGRALAMESAEGMVKLTASVADGKLLGCHAFGARASEIVQEVSSLMCRDTTLEQLQDMVHIHPTVSEIISEIAR